jgi:hypothetical protein
MAPVRLHGNASQSVHIDRKVQSRVTWWCCSTVRLGSGAEASPECWFERPTSRWKDRLKS